MTTQIKINVYLILIIVIAIILRLFKLDFQSLYGDELYSLIPTNPNNSLPSVIEYSKSDQPPLYFILLHFWYKMLPYNEYVGRLLSAVFGVLGVIAMYFLGVEFKNKEVGILASFLTAINYFHIYYSQELRFYSLLFLLTTLSNLFYLRCFKSPTVKNYISYCFFTICMIYTHYFGPVVVMAQAFIFIIFVFLGKRDQNFILYSIISALIIFLSYLPWLPTILQDTQIQSFWIAKPSPVFFGLYFYMYLGKDPFLAVLFLYFIGLFVYQYLSRNKYKQTEGETSEYIKSRFIILSIFIVVGYLIPYMYSIIKLPILEARYTLIVLPALLVVFSLGLSTISSAKVKRLLIAAIIISTTVNLLFFNQYYFKIIKDQYREAAAVVINNYQKPNKIYSATAYFYNYYFAKSNKGIEAVNPTTWYPGQSDSEADFQSVLANEQEVWILQGGPLTAVNEKQQAYLDEHFVPLQSYKFKGADAILYTRK